MREILFRGKRLDNGRWVEGAYFPESDQHPATIWEGKYCGIGRYVHAETVGQFTGLTDKNGKKIFEGDILTLLGSRVHIVRFEDGEFVLTGTAFPMRHANKFEIIGNIHDNPELLEV